MLSLSLSLSFSLSLSETETRTSVPGHQGPQDNDNHTHHYPRSVLAVALLRCQVPPAAFLHLADICGEPAAPIQADHLHLRNMHARMCVMQYARAHARMQRDPCTHAKRLQRLLGACSVLARVLVLKENLGRLALERVRMQVFGARGNEHHKERARTFEHAICATHTAPVC